MELFFGILAYVYVGIRILHAMEKQFKPSKPDDTMGPACLIILFWPIVLIFGLSDWK